MYSRKIKQMKKKLLSSSNPTSRSGGSASCEVGGSGGGGLHSSWGPRVAIYERELQEQQRRSREEQEQLYMAAKQQEIYNKSKASASSRSQSDGKSTSTGTSMFKNPYATSGIGIHTSNGFICKANKKLMMTDEDDDCDVQERSRHKPSVPDKPLRVRIPSPDPHVHARGRPAGAGLAIVARRRHASPTATNDSLASTKTYHSSGGSTHSSSSTLSSRGSHSSIDGRSSLIVGSDHHDSVHGHGHGHAMVSGNYNINGDDDDEEEYLGVGQRYRLRGRAHNGHGRRRNSPVLPLPPQSTMSSSHNVKLINVHLISDDESGGRAQAPANRSKPGAGPTGFYGKNIVRGQTSTSKNNTGKGSETGYEKRRDTESTITNAATTAVSNSKASKLVQGFGMVYVPMESTKARAQAQEQVESEDLPITTSHRRRQLVPTSESGYGGFQLPEEEIQRVPVQTVTKPPAALSENGLQSGGSGGRTTNASSVDADSLLESFDSLLFKPKVNGHGSSFSNKYQTDLASQEQRPKPSEVEAPHERPPLPRNKIPPPLPPKTRRLPEPQTQQSSSALNSAPQAQSQASGSTAGASANANPSKSNKNLRFSEHLDFKAPSPYTTISYETNPNAHSQSQNGHTSDSPHASGPSGPASRTSVYSACTMTTTLLSCGHLRDSYSTLSSLNSDAFTDENEGDRHTRQDARSTTTAQGDSIDTSIDCPIGDDDDDLDLDKGDDPSSHKSALQQLRDLSILIGGSFHTSPMIQTAVNAASAAVNEIHNHDKYGQTVGALATPSDEPAHKNYTKSQMRKFSTETSNDSGKGSATGSGRSRSEAGGSGSGRTNSIMQLLQHMPPVQQQADTSELRSDAQRQQKVSKVPVHGNSKSILAALNKITCPSTSNHNRETVADHHGHAHHQSGHGSTSSCSCDDSELSSCLFQPECEECQQVFGNPFEVLPELKYIDSQAGKQQPQSQPQSQTKHKKIKVLTSKKELARRNSYRLKSNPSKSKSGPMSSSEHATSSIEQRHKQQPPPPSLKLGYAGIGTKTQLLLSKSAHRDQSGGDIGCLGCYNEQLMLASGGGGTNCSPMMMTNSMMSPINLFTIDEAVEENDGTLHSHYAAAAASASSSSKLIRHGTAKTKRSHKTTKYGRGKKKSSAAKKSHHHHHGGQHHHRQKCDEKSKYVNGNPKCWLVTDGTMGWSDLESIYSQNMKNLDSPGAGNGNCNGNGCGGEGNPSRELGSDSPSNPSHGQSSQYVNGECVMCWRELMQYKYNNLPAAAAGIVDPNVSYTVERTKRMFIWLNRRPKEFSEPWWEAKKQASIKWLVTKAYNHMPKGSVQHPFKESKRDKTKMVLKDQVMAGLATGKLYCMALANLFQNCTLEEQQSIFGSRQSLKEALAQKNESEDDELLDRSRNGKSKKCGIKLSLSHWEIIKILSRKGIYVAQPSDMKLTEGTLRQRKPFRITAHIALIEAVMGLYAKVMLTQERIEPIVSNLGHDLDPDTHTSEEFILAWVNAVIDTLKAYILSTNINNARKHAVASSGSGSSPSSTFSHHRWLNVHPITDLRDLFDGIGLCSLFVLYFSTEVSFDQVCVNEPGETLNVYDSILNLNLVYDLTSQLFPQRIHHLRLTDLLYIHGYMKQNVLQLLLDIFYYTEVVPIDTVSRLTHVPLRIQL